MVKAKLIENNSYFQLRKKQIIILTIASIAPAIVLNVHVSHMWFWTAFGFYLLGIALIMKNQKKLSNVFGGRSIEMDDSEIRLTSLEENQYELMILDGEEVIILDKDFSNQEDAYFDNALHNDGKMFARSITIRKGGFERKLQFELESRQMTSQLNNVIEAWKTKGFQIQLAPTV